MLDPAAEVVRTAQAMHRDGLVAATTGNVSVRNAGSTVHITPSAVPYEEMTPDDVVVLERSGWSSARGRAPSSEFRLHLAIYRERPDVMAVVHTHSPHATAWSFLGESLDLDTEDLAHYCGGAVRTARFEDTGTEEIGEAALQALGDRRAVLLARHGAVGVGETSAGALDVCRVVEHQAEIAWILRAGGARR